jgi:N-dimethylarginine dimethylaminohydrolase
MKSILMSDANHFAVAYVINPWMENQIGQCQSELSVEQWNQLQSVLSQLTTVELIPSVANIPDLVFTANAGTVKDNLFVPSNFKHVERQAEEPIFKQWFQDNGYQVLQLPREVSFEGAGDALFTADEDKLWMGYGFRTDLSAAVLLEQHLQIEVIPLKLVDPRFYHLDTCFCPLDLGHVMYFPAALDSSANQQIEAYYTLEQRIVVAEGDAELFACNAVCVAASQDSAFSHTIVLNDCSVSLEERLNHAGYAVVKTPMSEFLKSGGATKCLTLQLPAR